MAVIRWLSTGLAERAWSLRLANASGALHRLGKRLYRPGHHPGVVLAQRGLKRRQGPRADIEANEQAWTHDDKAQDQPEGDDADNRTAEHHRILGVLL